MALSPTYCPSCGTPTTAQAAFCRNCGTPLTSGSLPPNTTGRLTSGRILKQRYRIIQIIGQGGMGAVYKAEDIAFGNRLVAVKEMRQAGLDPQEIAIAAKQFEQEAILLAGLRSPNLPSIYDHFSEGGRWYLVMDFIDGETLTEHLRKAPGGVLPIPEVLNIGIQLSKVLSYLHTRPTPIIFRDLKPSNIMLTPDQDIYLIDFGIARLFKPGQSRDTAIYGTAGYSSPEQFGQAQTTPLSDIYSLGVILHQVLTGHNPSSTPFRFPPLQLSDEPASDSLETLISHMLDMDPQKRPASMAVVRQELEWIAAQPKQQPLFLSSPPPPPPLPPTIPIPSPKPQSTGVSRRIVILSLAGLVGLAAVGGIALAVSHAQSITQPPTQPSQPPPAPTDQTQPTQPPPTQPPTIPTVNSSYNGTISDTNTNASSAMHLSAITQDNQGNISGTITIDDNTFPINGTGSFTGTVDSSGNINFTVPTNQSTATFTGSIQSDNSLSGTYTTADNVSNGNWMVS